MALQYGMTTEEYTAADDTVKTLYVEKDGAYQLDVTGLQQEDTGALKRAKDHEVTLRKQAQLELKELKTKAGIDADDALKKAGDVDALEKSWNQKFTDAQTDFDTRISAKDTFIKTSLIDNVAMQIAADISTSPAVMLPHIKARLSADLAGESPATKVLDVSGQASALTVSELSAEFVANKDFAGIIKAGNASGGGQNRDQERASGSTTKLSGMTPKQLAETIKANK